MAGSAQLAACGRQGTKPRAWRSLKSGDFAAALAAPVVAKTAHFVIHHLAASPASAVGRLRGTVVRELSTDGAPNPASSVDNSQLPIDWWLGLVVPKRHARRAVTRNLLKRQMRAQADGYRHRMPAGQWLVRLRAPFEPRLFPSAAPARLRDVARVELESVFTGAVPA